MHPLTCPSLEYNLAWSPWSTSKMEVIVERHSETRMTQNVPLQNCQNLFQFLKLSRLNLYLRLQWILFCTATWIIMQSTCMRACDAHRICSTSTWALETFPSRIWSASMVSKTHHWDPCCLGSPARGSVPTSGLSSIGLSLDDGD